MTNTTSRLQQVGTEAYPTPDGEKIRYYKRRFLTQAQELPVLSTVTVASRDRPDLVAARTLGNPLLFWQIADANDAMDPFDLTDVAGRILRVPVPQP